MAKQARRTTRSVRGATGDRTRGLGTDTTGRRATNGAPGGQTGSSRPRALAYAMPTHRVMSDRIRRAYLRATPEQTAQGLAWYPQARDWCAERAERYSTDYARVAVTVAALSPMVAWELNLDAAERMVAARYYGEDWPTVPGYRDNVDKAVAALTEEQEPTRALGGRKTMAFAQNLLGCDETVTVDRWAASIALDLPSTVIPNLNRAGRYDAIARAYAHVAAEYGIAPAAIQAICWLVVRTTEYTVGGAA